MQDLGVGEAHRAPALRKQFGVAHAVLGELASALVVRAAVGLDYEAVLGRVEVGLVGAEGAVGFWPARSTAVST
ncbi:MAG: hypothetical protein MSC31_16785 [Solirubrobacteraceae bacterium MAG38_C4-C5]|nr:hypothetical protein [Candidatus Siliceabacter maunaloa]